MNNRYFTRSGIGPTMDTHQTETAMPEDNTMTDYGRGDVLSARAEQAIDAEERAAEADEKRWADAEHEVAMMLHHEPNALIDMFHSHVREIADLDAMDAALIAFLKNERDGQSSDFYNAVVRIVMEQSK